MKTRAEIWEGPQEKCDFAFLLHSLYFIGEGFIDRCLQWLKPKGIAVVALTEKESSVNSVGMYNYRIATGITHIIFKNNHILRSLC